MNIKIIEHKQKDGYISFRIRIAVGKQRTQRLANYGQGLKCLATDNKKLETCRKLVELEVAEIERQAYTKQGSLTKHQLLQTNEPMIKYIQRFMLHKPITARRNYEHMLEMVKKFDQTSSIREMNLEWLQQFIGFMKTKELKHITINSYVKRVISVIHYAVAERIIDFFPFNAVPKLKVETKDILGQVLTKEDLSKIRSIKSSGSFNAKKPEENGLSQNATRTRDAFLFACYVQGLRVSDVINLKPCDIRQGITDSVLVKVHQKTSKLIKQEIPKPAYQILEPYLKEGRKSNVFGLSDRKNLAKHMKIIARLASLDKDLTFHMARKTFINLCFEAGMDITEVSKLCGDTMPILEKHYIAWTDARNRAAAQKWDKFLSSTN